MDVEYLKPATPRAEHDMHKDLAQRISNTLQRVWDIYPENCVDVFTLTSEIANNRMNRNPRTKNIKIRLECDVHGYGKIRIYNDGADFDDQTSAPDRPELVIDIIKRMEMEYFSEDKGETPVHTGIYTACRTVDFKLKK